jgi:hypothetical protein
MATDVDRVVEAAARAFIEDVFSKLRWHGREHEAVSHFAFGFLQRECKPGTPLSDATQIAIGGCVPGVPELNPKGRVNKDLVLWPKPRMSCWDADWNVCRTPMAILEWKVFRAVTRPPRISVYDLHWLEQFSRGRREFVGYAVSLDLAARSWRLRAARVHDSHTDQEWLTL